MEACQVSEVVTERNTNCLIPQCSGGGSNHVEEAVHSRG